jgi:hypothetical protein
MKALELKLRGLTAPVLILGIDDPNQLFANFLEKWPHRIGSYMGSPPFATLVHNGDRYLLKTNKYEEPKQHETLVNAVCDIFAAAARQRADERPQEMCLHAASVRMGEALVVFPAVRRAGKSSLTAALAAKGYQIFGDDVLSVASDPGVPVTGQATGAPIRLRLPLPDGLPEWMLDNIDLHRGPSNQQYLYYSPPEIASNGEQAPIGALVHLERGDDIATEFGPMSRGIMLRSLLKQNFARSATADKILCDLVQLAESTPAFLLRYSNVEEAVNALTHQFHSQAAPFNKVQCRPLQNVKEVAIIPSGADIVLRQDPMAVLREVEGEVFATNRDLTRILHLNEGTVRIWKILEEPTSEAEAVEILHMAFPDVSVAEIEADTQKAFLNLKRAGLVTVVDP